jgi:transcriptional regulator GlxA family with amidase domain
MAVCEDRRVARVVRIVMEDLSQRLSRDDAARIANLEPAYFSRHFRKTIGASFTAWNRNIRIDRAKVLLAIVDMSVTEVASAVGYNDVTTFERCFRCEIGITPRQFRRALLSDHERIRIAESKTRNAET